MKLRRFAEIVLIGRKAARRIGCTYGLNAARAGISPEQAQLVLDTVQEIERFTEDKLTALSRY